LETAVGGEARHALLVLRGKDDRNLAEPKERKIGDVSEPQELFKSFAVEQSLLLTHTDKTLLTTGQVGKDEKTAYLQPAGKWGEVPTETGKRKYWATRGVGPLD